MHHFNSGAIEVIVGPMFSGKTEELIRRVRRAQIARLKVQIFKPALDTRYDQNGVVSHSAQAIKALPVENSLQILSSIDDATRVVAIDEVQFFDEDIIKVVNKLARRGIRVICAGLDLDYLARPFGPMPHLLAISDDVSKIHAICSICGQLASRTYRTAQSNKKVLLGETDSYEARCRAHFDIYQDSERLPRQEEFEFQAKETTHQ